MDKEKEKRKEVRIKKTFTAQYFNKHTNCWNMTSMRDLSLGGACINSDEELPANDVIDFRLRVPTAPNTWIELKAKVISAGKFIVRVEFQNLSEKDKKMIKECIDWFLSSGGLR
jgi:hypothetical protein